MRGIDEVDSTTTPTPSDMAFVMIALLHFVPVSHDVSVSLSNRQEGVSQEPLVLWLVI